MDEFSQGATDLDLDIDDENLDELGFHEVDEDDVLADADPLDLSDDIGFLKDEII